MGMIGNVLRMHHCEKKSVREIAKATSLARNTVRKYLRIGRAEAPKYRRPAVPTKLTAYVDVVQQALPCWLEHTVGQPLNQLLITSRLSAGNLSQHGIDFRWNIRAVH